MVDGKLDIEFWLKICPSRISCGTRLHRCSIFKKYSQFKTLRSVSNLSSKHSPNDNTNRHYRTTFEYVFKIMLNSNTTYFNLVSKHRLFLRRVFQTYVELKSRTLHTTSLMHCRRTYVRRPSTLQYGIDSVPSTLEPFKSKVRFGNIEKTKCQTTIFKYI